MLLLPGGGFGDPHIKTLDKKTYTFNGHGEYIMLDIPTVFQLQCRTDRAVYSDNSLSDATVYSAFAAREQPQYGTLLQVELNDAKDGKFRVKNFAEDILKYFYYSFQGFLFKCLLQRHHN